MDPKSLTHQSFKDDCEINNIVDRFLTTGLIDHVNKHGQNYGFADGQTFYEAMQVVAEAKTMFEELPPQVREEFGFDPGKFLDFVDGIDTDADREKLVELGIASDDLVQRLQVEKRAESASEPLPVENEGVDTGEA